MDTDVTAAESPKTTRRRRRRHKLKLAKQEKEIRRLLVRCGRIVPITEPDGTEAAVKLRCACRKRWPPNYVGSCGLSYECFLTQWYAWLEKLARQEEMEGARKRVRRLKRIRHMIQVLPADTDLNEMGLTHCSAGRRRTASGHHRRRLCEFCDQGRPNRGRRYCLKCEPLAIGDLQEAGWTLEQIEGWLAMEDTVHTGAEQKRGRHDAIC